MAKKKKIAEAGTPSLETILFNCREAGATPTMYR